MKVRINASNAKRVAAAAAATSTSLASLTAVLPQGWPHAAATFCAWSAGAVAVAAGTASLVIDYLDQHPVVTFAEAAQRTDLSAVRELAVRCFGQKVSSMSKMVEWHKRNPNVFTTVTSQTHRAKTTLTELTGYFCTVPLSDGATMDLMAERKGINDVDAGEVCSSTTAPAGVYIGAIVVDNPQCRRAALLALHSRVKNIARNRKETLIMTRPVTKDGLRLVKALGLRPVRGDADDAMGVLHAARLSEIPILQRRTRMSS
jgi:hypothetical protein